MSAERPSAKDVSHGLKNALALMATYSELLGATDLDDDQRDMVKELKNAAQEALELHGVLDGLIDGGGQTDSMT